MRLFGHRCTFCGMYIKLYQRTRHERWHADQIVCILRLLCSHCATEHGKDHSPCGGATKCRCICNEDD